VGPLISSTREWLDGLLKVLKILKLLCCALIFVLQAQLVGIHAAGLVRGCSVECWDLPIGWAAPQQLRILKCRKPSAEALSSLSFPSNSRLQLLHIEWSTCDVAAADLPTRPTDP
jgi:hypothetical protein